MASSAPRRDLDVVLYGATGFVGRLTADYLARHAPAGLRVGLAGRSPGRLAALRDTLPPPGDSWPLVVADSCDPASLAALAARCRVVATTVGPYLRYGLGLVQACAEAGTHYADLTGEVLFARRSIDAFHGLAQDTGARIVHSCGFDSVPSDLAVLALHHAAHGDGAGDLEDVTLAVVSLRGCVSGGTIDSLRAEREATSADRSLCRVVADPYALSPARAAEPWVPQGRDLVGVGHDPRTGEWIGPFVMAPYNARVVRRSNALLGWAYGRRFRYREVMSYGRSPVAPVVAATVTAATVVLTGAMTFRPTRAVLDLVLPSPGDGPGERTRRRGRFAIQARARTSSGAWYLGRIAARGDPGYQATSVMLGESALCLAADPLPPRAGVLTPATALGSRLAERLRAAGFELQARRASG